MKPIVILAAALTLCAPSNARDREFDAIVQGVEARYDTSRPRIPFFGLANFFVKVARPGGATDLKLAVFEDMRRPMVTEEEDFTGLVREELGPDWHPFVRAHERQNNAWTCIYSNWSGGHWKLLIATYRAARRDDHSYQAESQRHDGLDRPAGRSHEEARG